MGIFDSSSETTNQTRNDVRNVSAQGQGNLTTTGDRNRTSIRTRVSTNNSVRTFDGGALRASERISTRSLNLARQTFGKALNAVSAATAIAASAAGAKRADEISERLNAPNEQRLQDVGKWLIGGVVVVMLARAFAAKVGA